MCMRNQVKEKLYVLETPGNPVLGTSLIHPKIGWAWRGTADANNTHWGSVSLISDRLWNYQWMHHTLIQENRLELIIIEN